MEEKLCKCGCGLPVINPKNIYIKGHYFKVLNESRKGEHPWNYGLTKETDERVKRFGEKQSITKKERSKDPEYRKRINDKYRKSMGEKYDSGWKSWTPEREEKYKQTWKEMVENGYVSPMKGKPKNISDGERKRRSDFLKEHNPMNNPESRKKVSMSTKGVPKPCHFSEEERKRRSIRLKNNNPMSDPEILDSIRGENHYHFDKVFYEEHGVWKSIFPYTEQFSPKMKRWVLKLYDNKCVITGITNEEHKRLYGRSLTIHHWNYNKDESSMYWLVPVSQEINAMANYDQDAWISLFGGIVEEKMNSIKMLG